MHVCSCIYIYIYITMLINLVCRKCYKYVHAYQRVALVTYTYIYITIYYGGRYVPSSAAVDVRRWSGRPPDAFVCYIASVFASV